jgi:hypothetical protein
MKTAYATIKGFEVMRPLRKGQAAIFNLMRNIRGEANDSKRGVGRTEGGPSLVVAARSDATPTTPPSQVSGAR